MTLELEHIWKRLGDVAIDADENIEEPFLGFPIGTPRQEIWHWLEETFSVSVHDLMFPRC